MEENRQMEAVERMKRKTNSMYEELIKVKQMEVSCQRCKERLLKRKSLMTTSIKTRCANIADVVEETPPTSRKLFDQLYSHVDDIYQLELLMLELNQQLMVVKATREEETILKALKSASWDVGDPEMNRDHSCTLGDWFQQISHVKKVLEPEASGIPLTTSKEEGRINEDRVFYWAKYVEMTPCQPGRHAALTFSTRHCGVCLRLCVTAVMRLSEGTWRCDPDSLTITSDLPLEGLQLGLQRSIQDGQMAHEFVIRTVWRLIDEQLVPLISS